MFKAPFKTLWNNAGKFFLTCSLLSQNATATVLEETFAPADESSLTIYVYPPYVPLNWTSPKSLLDSFAKIAAIKSVKAIGAKKVRFQSDYADHEAGEMPSNYISTMGHTLIKISCTLPSKERYTRWTSLSGDNSMKKDLDLVLKDELALGALFFNFVDGHIINGEENAKRVVHYKGTAGNKPRYMKFMLTPEGCGALKSMVTRFEMFHTPADTPLKTLEERARLNPASVLYFNNWDPYETYLKNQKNIAEMMGGGCAPYGYALMKISGQSTTQLFDQVFLRPVQISERLIGGTITPNNQTRRVNILELLATRLGTQWQWPGYANQLVTFTDPQYIWDFIGQVQQCISSNGSSCHEHVQKWVRYQLGDIQNGPVHQFTDVDYLTDYPKEDPNSAKQQISGIVIPLEKDKGICEKGRSMYGPCTN